MINGFVMGTLFGTAEMRKGKNASNYAVAKVKAPYAGGDTIIVNVISFDVDTCKGLMALKDGGALAMSGSITPKVWSDKQGNTRPALDMVANKLLSAYPETART